GVASVAATSATSTVDYNGSGAQTVAAFAYQNLTISGTRTSNSVTLAPAGTIAVAGTFNPSATFNPGVGYVITGSAVNYTGASQTVAAFNYNNLTLSGTGTPIFAAGTVAFPSTGIAGTLSVSGPTGVNLTTNNTTINYNGASQPVA